MKGLLPLFFSFFKHILNLFSAISVQVAWNCNREIVWVSEGCPAANQDETIMKKFLQKK